MLGRINCGKLVYVKMHNSCHIGGAFKMKVSAGFCAQRVKTKDYHGSHHASRWCEYIINAPCWSMAALVVVKVVSVQKKQPVSAERSAKLEPCPGRKDSARNAFEGSGLNHTGEDEVLK